MDLKYRIQNYLKNKLLSKKIKLINLARESGIPYSTLHPLRQGTKANPELRSLLRIANHFKCSLDEVIGRDPKYLPSNPTDYQFYDLSTEEINANLKQFITQKIQQDNISLSKLSLNIGFGKDLIGDFIKEDRSLNSLGSAPVAALADYFDVSIDQMIGRTPPTPQKAQMAEKSQEVPAAVQKLSTKDMESLQQIKHSISTKNQTVSSSSKTVASKQTKNNKDHVR